MTKKRFEARRREHVMKAIRYAQKRGDRASVKKMYKHLYRMPRPTFEDLKSYSDNMEMLNKAFSVFD